MASRTLGKVKRGFRTATTEESGTSQVPLVEVVDGW